MYKPKQIKMKKIDIFEIVKGCRTINLNELISLLQMNQSIFWSWGAHAFTVDNKKDPKMFRMKVNGHHHKGHVYIFVNGMDLFDVYLTTTKGNIVKKFTDIYFDQLVEMIDNAIEKVKEYGY